MGYWNFIRSRSRRLRELSRREAALLGAALALLPVTAIGLQLAGFQRLHRWLQHCGPRRTRGIVPGPENAAYEAARMVTAAARYSLIGKTCLPQAMVLSFLLQRMGLDGELRIGVRQESRELKAHAWVEWEGRILNDMADVHERYAAFAGPICPALGGSGT
jgi:hypothetical protein